MIEEKQTQGVEGQKVDNTYLLTFLEAEGEQHVSIKAQNILQALIKFAKQYHDICFDWGEIALNIQVIQSIE